MRPAWEFHAFLMRAAWDLNTRRVKEEARGPPQLNQTCNAGREGPVFQIFKIFWNDYEILVINNEIFRNDLPDLSVLKG